jgi:hypothetical protein
VQEALQQVGQGLYMGPLALAAWEETPSMRPPARIDITNANFPSFLLTMFSFP